jgi:hypothetical protein
MAAFSAYRIAGNLDGGPTMIRKAVFTTTLAALAASMLVTDANANHRYWRHHRLDFDRYYAGPIYIPVPRVYKYISEFGDPFEESDAAYGDSFDNAYYEPSVEPSPAKPSTLKRKKPALAAAKSGAAVKPAGKQASLETTKPMAAPPLTCDKATGVVAGFGFGDVKPSDCNGQVYAFNATRDGKSYAIKLNATSGQLTEVRKVQ